MASSRNSAPADGLAAASALRACRDDAAPRAGTADRHQASVAPRDAPAIVAVDPRWPRHWRHTRAGARVAVALSGGSIRWCCSTRCARCARDSRSRCRRFTFITACRRTPTAGPTSAPQSARRAACRLTVHRVDVARQPRPEPRSAARAARYERSSRADVDVVALAHHADDQAETVLLQLLRGAGPRGSPRCRVIAPRRAGPALLRPLLALPRATLAAYANARGLAWIDDESNADPRHRRNLLRHEIAPRLAAAFPGYPATLVRAAAHQAEAALCSTSLPRSTRAARRRTSDSIARALAALSPRPRRAICCAGSCAARACARRPTARLAEMLAQLLDAARRRAHAHRARRRRNRHPSRTNRRPRAGRRPVRLAAGTASRSSFRAASCASSARTAPASPRRRSTRPP